MKRIAVAFGALLVATPHASGQQLVRQEDAVVALFALQTEMEVDAKILQRLELKYEESRHNREEQSLKVAKLYADLDRLFTLYRSAIQGRQSRGEGAERETEVTPETLQAQIEEKEQEIVIAERGETAVRDEGRRLREQIRGARDRMSLRSERIDALVASMPSQRDTVSGVWDLTLMPGGEKGVFALFQSGTLVSGQYVLDGPFQGSLDGTLVDRKILLHRIDSRLGRSMDFSGFLSPDGQAIKGTWENYDLSNGQTRNGSWSARRRQPRKVGEDADGREGGNQ